MVEDNHLSILSIFWSLFLIFLIFLRVNSKAKFLDLHIQKYYKYNVYTKITLALVYAFYYLFFVGGGDTLAYWKGGVCLNNLFWSSPSMFFEEIFSDPEMYRYWLHYDGITGFPPGWIYREKESWFVSKIMFFFTLITFKSYLAGTIILAYISSVASWKLFLLAKEFTKVPLRNIAIATLFIPSVSFWCSGVSKDTLILFSSILIIINIFELLFKKNQKRFNHLLIISLHVYLIFQTRDFMLFTIGAPLFFVLMTRLANKNKLNKVKYFFIRFLTIITIGISFLFLGDSIADSDKMKEASKLQQDFAVNETYEGVRYNIGVTDFTSTGILLAFPGAFIAGVFRPFIWESNSLSLIFNGIESIYFMYLTYFFLFKGGYKNIKKVITNEMLIFSLFFLVLLAFIAGLTSGLLGVLVRFKSPLLPFLVLVLSSSFIGKKVTK